MYSETENSCDGKKLLKVENDMIEKSRKKDTVKYSENPFLADLTVPTGRRYKNLKGGTFSTYSEETGENLTTEVAQITHVEQVDKEKFVKLFTDELKTFFDLKPATQKILQVVLSELQKTVNGQTVYLDYKIVLEYFINDTDRNGKPLMSRPTFHRATKELMEKQFIAESTYANQYFINPKLFFNGDRLKLVKEYVIKQNDKLTNGISDQNKNDNSHLLGDDL